MKNPKVSVVMPVYNAEKYIEKTINAILNQSFSDFELLLIDDHPTDKTWDVINAIKDPRIRVLRNDKNRGIAYSRSRGVKEAVGEYIALMDDDDLSPLDRLEKEVDFLDTHPEIGCIGGNIIHIDENDREIGEKAFMHTDYNDVHAQMMFFCPMANSSTLYRKSIVDEYNLEYRDGMLGMEDYRFWVEMSLHTKIVNVQDVFLYWRRSGTNETANVLDGKKEQRKEMFANILLYALEGNGFRLTEAEKKIYTEAFGEGGVTECTDLERLRLLLQKLISQAYDMEVEWAYAFQLACRNHFLNVARAKKIKYIDALGETGFSNKKTIGVDLPLVSVVIPTHNRERDILNSIESVLNQTYKNVEIIVVDDASTDYTFYIANGYAATLEDAKKVRVVRMEKNGGPAKARNKGASLARGKYIAFHDDDDVWHPDKLELQMKELLYNKEIGMSFAQMARFQKGQYVNCVDEKLDWDKFRNRFFQELLLDNYVGAPTIVIRKEDFVKLGGFNEELECIEDWEFAISAAKKLKISFLATPCMDVHISDKSVSHDYKNYAKSWGYIYNEFFADAEDELEYGYQMLRHLDGAIGVDERWREYVDLSVECLDKDQEYPRRLLRSYYLGHDRNVVINETGGTNTGSNEENNRLQQAIDKLTRYKNVSKVLMRTDNRISEYLKENNISKVAIYGMGILGNCLVEHLKRGGIDILCGIDKNVSESSVVKIISIEEFVSEARTVDAIIITPLYEVAAIEAQINKGRNYKCLSIEDIC